MICNLFKYSIFAVFFCLSLVGWALAEEEESSCVSQQCHSAMTAGENVHPQAVDCESCHQQTGKEHPGQGAKAFQLIQPAICTECHEMISAKSTHPPVAAGECGICHSYHGSMEAKLLPKSEKEICLACHRDVISQKMTFLHGSIAEEKCSPCHEPHAADHEKLLIKEYSLKLFESYTDTKYDLCFSCHNSNLLRFPDTSFSTGFRDGNRNLHFLHVNKKIRGRSCRLCHVVHGSSLPLLVAETVPFGTWQLPLHFEKAEDGGSCNPGCHKSTTYDRKRKNVLENK